MKDAELIADSVPERRDLQRRERIQEAGGEAPEAAVAEARLVLAGEQLIEVQPEFADRLAHLHMDPQVEEVVAEVRTQQKLGGQMGDGAGAVGRVGGRRADPPV